MNEQHAIQYDDIGQLTGPYSYHAMPAPGGTRWSIWATPFFGGNGETLVSGFTPHGGDYLKDILQSARKLIAVNN